MDSPAKSVKSATPVKDRYASKSKISGSAENANPNVSQSSPGLKTAGSPLTKSAKSVKSVTRYPNPALYSPRKKIRERKFIVAKKKSKKENLEENSAVVCKCNERLGGNMKKCLCIAYETLRASQEEFFKSGDGVEENTEVISEKVCDVADGEVEEEIEKSCVTENFEIGIDDESGHQGVSPEIKEPGQVGDSTIKRRRDEVLEQARSSLPERGKVKHLVKAFETVLSFPSSNNVDENRVEDNYKSTKWALPGMQPPNKVSSSSSFCPTEFILTSQNLGLESNASVSSSWDSARGSLLNKTSIGGWRSRRNSSESSGTMDGRKWKQKQQLRATSLKPFKLKTEERGRQKEEEFIKKCQEMMIEEERQRIPIAQGLPWTTDEPECLIKPPVKECTRTIDLKLHSDIRAEERAEFDHQIEEKMSMIEQYKMERERQQKLAEEEEIRRLRKELVPKAQPMPYFDRPFVPRRSTKNPTIPIEPKFHHIHPQQKKIKSCLSWDNMSTTSFPC